MKRKRNQETLIIKPRLAAGEDPKNQDQDWEPERLALEGTNWTDNQWALIVWEATPIPVRVPVSLTALATKIGVTDRTLYNWRKLPKFREQVRAIARTYLEQDLPSIYYALSDQAQRGSFPHIKLVLELLGEYTERYDVTSGNKPFAIQTYSYGAAIAPLTEGSASDSNPSG